MELQAHVRAAPMIELASRLPARLSPRQTVLVLAVVAGILLAVLAWNLLESAFIGFLGLVLRLTGHRPPRKSSFSTVLDEFEARLHRKDD
jgi:cytosine/uracil/thiamine/allantoin permease